MVWLVLFLLLGLGGLISLLAAIFGNDSEDPSDLPARTAGILGIITFAVLNIGWSLLMSTHIVDAREIGVVRTFGSITGQIGEGIQFTWPWQTVEKWNIRTQIIEPDSVCSNGIQKCMDAGSVDVQDVYIQAALNISVDPRAVQQLARTIGSGYKETIVLNRLEQVVKETTALYKAENILAAREEIRKSVRERMTVELAEYSIRVDDFLLTNVDFTDAFKQAIEAKVVAVQQAQQEQNRIEVARAQAQQVAATAQGRADALRIEAEGQAAANRLISESLTPLLVQFQALQKLADNVTIALIPSGAGILIDPATLLGPP